MQELIPLIIILILIIVGYTSGRIVESKHYQSIEAREKQFLHLPAVTMKNALDTEREIARAQLVTGSAVISVDYFKRFLAGLRNLFGGRMSSYETLIDRARREAILRMKEATKKADIILNLRIETSSISKGAKKTIGSIEALAYGTAVSYKPGSSPKPRARSSVSQAPVEEQPAIQVPSPETRYKVVFSGEIIAGQELETVKKRVAALYKVPVERCESMFSGRLMTVKENVDYPTAQKYQKAFERTGAVCRIEPL